MKTQTFGISNGHLDNVSQIEGPPRQRIKKLPVQTVLTSYGCGNLPYWAVCNYRTARENGTGSDSPPNEFPDEYERDKYERRYNKNWEKVYKNFCKWTKGKVKFNGYIYGVKEKDGHYHYELRYDESPQAREWMEEKDRNYLARLFLLGTNNDVERKDLKENQQRAKKAAEEIKKLPKNKRSKALTNFEDILQQREEKQNQEEKQKKIEAERRKKEEQQRRQEELRRKEEVRRKEKERQQQELRRRKEAEQQRQKDAHAEADKLYAKGEIFYQNKQYKAALVYFNKALKFDPNHDLVLQFKQFAEEALQKQVAKPIPSSSSESARASSSDDEKKDGKINKKIDPNLINTSYLIPFKDIQIDKNNELGQGGFGVVYKAKWQYTTVAVKQLFITKMTENGLKEFEAEAKIQASLTHPNVLRLYGICLESGNYSIVTKYMKKGSLYELLHSSASLSWKQIYKISYRIGTGIYHLHEKNILHRDLKSLNVLLDENLNPKVCDFGLSRLKDETKTTSSGLGSMQVVGTYQWMAPELFGRPKYSKKSDVYGYGMIMWELATREIPWRGVDNISIKDLVKTGEREEMPKKCPKSYAALIAKCWAQRAEDRPEINEVLKELETNKQEIVSYNP